VVEFFTFRKENCSHEKADPHINLNFSVSFFVEDSVCLKPVGEKSSTIDQSKTMDKVCPFKPMKYVRVRDRRVPHLGNLNLNTFPAFNNNKQRTSPLKDNYV
jgi:hypothetical protein